MMDLSEDPMLERVKRQREIIAELMHSNAKLRSALLLIREHKLPYDRFTFDQGTNGVRDFFIGIADKALRDN